MVDRIPSCPHRLQANQITHLSGMGDTAVHQVIGLAAGEGEIGWIVRRCGSLCRACRVVAKRRVDKALVCVLE